MMNDKNTDPALGLEKVVTRDDALEALKRLSFNCVSYIGKATDKMIVRQALEQSLDGGLVNKIVDMKISPVRSEYGCAYNHAINDILKLLKPQPPKSEE